MFISKCENDLEDNEGERTTPACRKPDVIKIDHSLISPAFGKPCPLCAIISTMLKERIYYIDSLLLDLIEKDFELVDCDSWYKLYRNKSNGTYWRLDVFDKLQEQYLVRIDDLPYWKTFDATNLKIELLKNTRGESENNCMWRGCSNKSLSQLVFCKHHAFIEMGIRR